MLTKKDIEKTYIDYTIYSVIKLKNKYGFRIKLLFNDETEDIIQIGGFNKKSEANKVITELNNRTFIIQPKIKFSEYIMFWLDEIMKPKIKYNTYQTYKSTIKNYAVPFFKDIYISHINLGHIQEFYNSISNFKSIPKVAKNILCTSMEYAKEKNLITVNIARNVELPKNIEKLPYKTLNIDKEKTFSVEQVKQLIEASKKTPIYLHILFAVLMGLRKQEINGLKYTDIDYINRKLYLQRQLGVDMNKTKTECKSKTYTKQEIPLKTYYSERILDIPDLVFEAILEERKKYERNRSRRINDKSFPFLDENYICCSTYGHSRSKGFHTKYYKKLLEECNLPKIRFHDLRHTYTTLLLMNNFDLKAVSQLLGHSSTIITNSTYFDKNKIIIDCTKELEDYIEQVKPLETNNDSEILMDDININKLVKEYLK